MIKTDRPICVVHILENSDLNYYLSGKAVFLVIDERFPHDRVYQMTLQTPSKKIAALVGSSPIGNRHDALTSYLRPLILALAARHKPSKSRQ
jgi:hypothetical protein